MRGWTFKRWQGTVQGCAKRATRGHRRQLPLTETLEVRCLLSAVDLRIMTYNALKFGDNAGDRQDEFSVVFNDLDPDIVVMQEIVTEFGADTLLASMNSQGVEYARAEFINGNDTDHMLFYRASTVSLVSQNYIDTDLRAFGEYTVSVANQEFNLYSAHLKAGSRSRDVAQRLGEVTILRDHLAGLPADTEYLVLGDMNFYRSSESGYQKMTADENGAPGQLVDLVPAELVGSWHDNAAFQQVHSQSPRTARFGGGANGGMDDRFDFIFSSEGLNDGTGLEYLTDTYFVHGNDGQHLNQSILVAPNNSAAPEVLQALHDASDHLPVVAQFQVIPANVPDVFITESGGESRVVEGGATDTYEVQLAVPPLNDVVIQVSPSSELDLGNGPGLPVDLLFTATNALVPQTVTVTALDDADDEGIHQGTILHSVSSSDPGYDGLSVRSVIVTIEDNDQVLPSAVINEVYVNPPDTDDTREFIELRTSTGSTELNGLWLLEIEGDGSGAGTIDAVQNLNGVSTGSNGLLLLGDGYSTSLPWAIDSATAVGNLTGTTMENGTVSFLLVRNFSGSNGNDLDLDNDGVLDLTPWTEIVDSVGWTDGSTGDQVYSLISLAQPGVPDAATRFANSLAGNDFASWYNGDIQGTGFATTYDPASASQNLPANASISPGRANDSGDDPVPGITIAESGGVTEATEGGSNDSYTLVLDSIPSSDVSVTITPDTQIDIGGGAGQAITIVFSVANALDPQTVTILAVDDEDVEGNHTGEITHSVSSVDPDYNGLSVPGIQVAITDNDSPPVDRFARATGESNRYGEVTGTYLATHESDDVRQVLSEELYGGRKRTRLEHRWTFSVSTGDKVIFHLEASHDSSVEDFIFEYSLNSGSTWVPILVLTSSQEIATSVDLPGSVSGDVLVRVRDTNQSRGENSVDRVSVDQILFETVVGSGGGNGSSSDGEGDSSESDATDGSQDQQWDLDHVMMEFSSGSLRDEGPQTDLDDQWLRDVSPTAEFFETEETASWWFPEKDRELDPVASSDFRRPETPEFGTNFLRNELSFSLGTEQR